MWRRDSEWMAPSASHTYLRDTRTCKPLRTLKDPKGEIRRITLPRTSLNKPRALLRVPPLYSVDDLLSLGREPIEVGRPASVAQDDRLSAQLVLQDDQAHLVTL